MSKDLTTINEEFELFIQNINPSFDTKKIRDAYEFSKKAHVFQNRQTGEPYISHPFEVAKIVYELGLDEQSIIAALLHDVVEDTEITLEKIKDRYGREVELIVDGLSKIEIFAESKEERNIEALKKILLASAKDIRILIIKLCDRLHNLRTIENLPEEKRSRVANETLLIYVPIAQKIGIYSLKWELEDLSFKFQNPEMYRLIKAKLGLKRKEREEIVKKAVQEIKDVLNMHNISNTILVIGRPKNFYSIYKKIKDKAKEFEEIYDLYAIRIITKNIAECYTVLGIMHENFQSFPDRLKDYIANPKANGYESIHTVIYSRSIQAPVEVQIRTENMHNLAEYGVAAHWRYKNLQEDKRFEKKISWLREVLQWEKEHKGDNQEFLKLLKFDFFEDEIFIFTPKKDIVTLPEGASALDFAYAVHTDVGHKAYKAKINGVPANIDKILNSGDVVEIITNNSVKPSEKWLKIIKTTKARLKIKDAINLKHSGKQADVVNEVTFEKLKEKITRIEEFKKTRKAGCCSFKYGDQIVGVVGKEKDLVIHNAKCENAKYAINLKIPLNWKEEKIKEVTLNLVLKDRFGIIIEIMNIFSEFNLNISKLNTTVNKDGSVKMDITILDGPYMDTLISKLKELEFVSSAKVNRGLFTLPFIGDK